MFQYTQHCVCVFFFLLYMYIIQASQFQYKSVKSAKTKCPLKTCKRHCENTNINTMKMAYNLLHNNCISRASANLHKPKHNTSSLINENICEITLITYKTSKQLCGVCVNLEKKTTCCTHLVDYDEA